MKVAKNLKEAINKIFKSFEKKKKLLFYLVLQVHLMINLQTL